MKAKKVMAILMAGLMCISGFTACTSKGGTDDTDVKSGSDTLKIYCLDAGYGTEWLTKTIEAFEQQDWVKEKYPNLKIEQPLINNKKSFAESLLTAGGKTSQYDLIFGMGCDGYKGPTGGLYELTECLYNSEIPGEGVIYKDKMNDSALESNRYVDSSDLTSETYWSTSWAGGNVSILYNKTILDSFGLAMPNTTDEFINACAVIKANEGKNNGKYNKGASILQSSDAQYWQYTFPVWWAQYDGIEDYLNFYNGISNGRYSNDIFKKEGRLESLKVLETVLNYDTGYLAKDSFSFQFMQAQTSFLQGEAVFHVNGDWFANEMKNTIAQIGSNDEFGTMRMPIVSALGKKLGITDAELSAIVDFIDGDVAEQPAFTSTVGYSAEEVIDRVKEARSVNYSIGPGHMAMIPDNAVAKDLAVDFLLFMATDKGLECYAEGTGGSSLPFEYNFKEKNPELFDSFSAFTQDVQNYFNNGNFSVYTLPSSNSFPLYRYGGLKPLISESYYVEFSGSGKSKTAQQYFDETKEYWTTEKFNEALGKAGIM